MRDNLQNFGLLLLLSFIWGTAYVAVKYALMDYTGLEMVALRLLIASIVTFLYLRLVRQRMPRDWESWKVLILAGMFSIFLPFVAISYGMKEISAGMSSVIVAMTPIFAMMISKFYLSDHGASPKQIFGMIVGFCGVFILMGGADLFAVNIDTLSKLALLFAAFSYALSAVIMRKISTLSTTVTSAGMMLVGMVATLILLFAVEDPLPLTFHAQGFTAIVFLAVFSSFMGIMLMTHLIYKVGPTFMTLNSYLVPPVAIVWGAYLLDEAFTLEMGIGAAMILSALYFVGDGKKIIPVEEHP